MTTATALPARPLPVAPVAAPATGPVAGPSGHDGEPTGDGAHEHDFSEVLAAIALVAATVHDGDAPVTGATVVAGANGSTASVGGAVPGASTALPTVPLVDGSSEAAVPGNPAATSRPTAPDGHAPVAPSAPTVEPSAGGASLAGDAPNGTSGQAAVPALRAVAGLGVALGSIQVAAITTDAPADASRSADDASTEPNGPTTVAVDDSDAMPPTGPSNGETADPGQRPLPPHAATASAVTTPATADTDPTATAALDTDDASVARGPRPVPIEGAARLGVTNRIRVDLGDEGLGALTVTATAERGAVNLIVNAAEERTRDALLQQRSDLLDDLESAGVRLGTLDINARDDARDDRDADPGANRGSRDRHDDTTDPEPVRRRSLADPTRLDLHL